MASDGWYGLLTNLGLAEADAAEVLLRPDQEQVASPVPVEAMDNEPEELVPRAEAGPRLRAEDDLELLAEEQVLEEEALAAAEGAGEQGEEELEEFDHPGGSPNAAGQDGQAQPFAPLHPSPTPGAASITPLTTSSLGSSSRPETCPDREHPLRLRDLE